MTTPCVNVDAKIRVLVELDLDSAKRLVALLVAAVDFNEEAWAATMCTRISQSLDDVSSMVAQQLQFTYDAMRGLLVRNN